jgi:membrane protease YdiL (CAAX protease family)
MAVPSLDSILFSALFAILLALVLGMLGVWAWALRRIWSGQPLLPSSAMNPPGEPAWGAFTVFAVIFVYFAVNIGVSRLYAAVTRSHFPGAARQATEDRKEILQAKTDANAKDQATGPDKKNTLQAEDSKTDPAAAEVHANATREQSQTELLLQLAVINSLLLVLVPWLVRELSGASLADLGIRLEYWRQDIAIGVVAALLMTPAVYAVQSLAVRIWRSQQHPVEEMVMGRFSIGVAVLAVLSTMILAPMIEELLFRGIIQRWLTALLSGHRSITAKPDEAPSGLWDTSDLDQPLTAIEADQSRVVDETEPSDIPSGTPARAVVLSILLTSFIFAAMHLAQWPAPIAIFLLSMALGILYQSTGSLIAVIAMHGTFNGFSTLLLLLEALSRQIQPRQAAAVEAILDPALLSDISTWLVLIAI